MRRERGFSLFEALIAILMVCFGVLGTAGLQLASMRNSTESSSFTQAVRLSSTYAERIRGGLANKTFVDAYVTATVAAHADHAPSGPNCSSDAKCETAQQLAARDAYEWKRSLAAELPAGDGALCRENGDPYAPIDPRAPCGSGDVDAPVVVKVWWRTRAADGQVTDPAARRNDSRTLRPQIVYVVTP